MLVFNLSLEERGFAFGFCLGINFHFTFHLALRHVGFVICCRGTGFIADPLIQLSKSVNHRAQLTFLAQASILGHQLNALSGKNSADVKLLHWRLILSTDGKAMTILILMMKMSLRWKRELSVNRYERGIFHSQEKQRRWLILSRAIAGAKISIHNQALGSILLNRQTMLVLKLLWRHRQLPSKIIRPLRTHLLLLMLLKSKLITLGTVLMVLLWLHSKALGGRWGSLRSGPRQRGWNHIIQDDLVQQAWLLLGLWLQAKCARI